MNLNKFGFNSLNTHNLFELNVHQASYQYAQMSISNEWQNSSIANNHNVRFVQ